MSAGSAGDEKPEEKDETVQIQATLSQMVKKKKFNSDMKAYSWYVLACNPEISDGEYFERVKFYWELIAATSTILVGFNFIVVSSPVEFKFGIYWLIKLWAGTQGCSLAASIGSLFMAILLIGYLNVVGPPHAKAYVIEYWYLPDVPISLMFLSIFFLFGSVSISAWGFYGKATFAVILSAMSTSLGGCIFAYFSVSKYANLTVIIDTESANGLPSSDTKKEK
jgi:hypothetical protein